MGLLDKGVLDLPLAALIAAQLPLENGEGLRATLPLAGRTLIEFQARTARAAGAERIILLVEKVPAALAQAIDRLRNEGVVVEAARSVTDAADRFHVDDRILLIADGCIVPQSVVDRLTACSPPALLTVQDMAEYGLFERIDADARWAGYALTDAALLQGTVRQLGDWDLTSTLLRRSVQDGALRIDARAPENSEDAGIPPIIALNIMSLRSVDAMLMRQPAGDDTDWAERYIHRLVSAPLLAPLISHNVQPLAIASGSVAVAFIGAVLALFDFFWAGALLLPLSAAAFAVAQRMGRIWAAEIPYARALGVMRLAAALLALTALSRHLADISGWGWWGVGASIPLGLTALAALRPIASAVGPVAWPLWLPGSDGLVWLMPFIAILLGWAGAMAALALYVFAAFAWQFVAVRNQATAGIRS